VLSPYPASVAVEALLSPHTTFANLSDSRLDFWRFSCLRPACHVPRYFHSGADLGQVVVAMAQGVILHKELAGEWRVCVQGDRSRLVQLLIRQCSHRDGGGLAGGFQDGERRRLLHPGVLLRMARIQGVDVIPTDALDGVAPGQGLGQLHLEGVHAGDMMDDDAHRAPVMGDLQLPLGLVQRRGVLGERRRSCFEAR
jgi:hypothetical protein